MTRLIVLDFECDAQLITETLGVQPSKTCKGGERVHSRAINVHHQNGWMKVSPVDPPGLQTWDSVTNSLREAIRHGNVAEIRNILDVSVDVLSAEWKQVSQEAITKLQTPAEDLIRATVKRSASYSSELEKKHSAICCKARLRKPGRW